MSRPPGRCVDVLACWHRDEGGRVSAANDVQALLRILSEPYAVLDVLEFVDGELSVPGPGGGRLVVSAPLTLLVARVGSS